MYKLNNNSKSLVTASVVTAIQNPESSRYKTISISDQDADNIGFELSGGQITQIFGNVSLTQDFATQLDVPAFEVGDGFVNPAIAPSLPSSIALTNEYVQAITFEVPVIVSASTTTRGTKYFVSRTGKEGTWFTITGQTNTAFGGTVYFKGQAGKTLSLNVSTKFGHNKAELDLVFLVATDLGALVSNESEEAAVAGELDSGLTDVAYSAEDKTVTIIRADEPDEVVSLCECVGGVTTIYVASLTPKS